MNHNEAIALLGVLAAAYPRQLTEQAAELGNIEETVEIWRRELVKLDGDAGRRAVKHWIEREKWFPTIAEFRDYYRSSRRDLAEPVAELAGARSPVPVWVHVWKWQMDRTRLERQVAREESRQAVVERAPVKMRDFPQFERPGPDVYSQAEYEQLEAEWRAAGEPQVKDVSGVIPV